MGAWSKSAPPTDSRVVAARCGVFTMGRLPLRAFPRFHPPMHTLDYVVLVGYFVVMIVIGVFSAMRIKKQEDYFMGGRNFGKLLQTFAAFGAGTGSSDPVNVGRTTYTSGMSGMWSVMSWLFVTPFYWITGVWYRRMRHLTLGDWYVERYESKAMGLGYCLFGLAFHALYGSMLFSAIGKVAAPLVGIDSFAWGGQVYGIEYLLVPVIGVVVLVYGILGGLQAAYYTDLIQGLCIILLSIILIPFGLTQLVDKFGDPATQSLWQGFRIMHEQLPASQFAVVGTESSDFPLHRIIAVVIISLIGVVVQPHFIATGGGSAKTETSARVGLVLGNFLKRFCTVGWVLTALIAVALYAGSSELAGDPDKTWGVASRELLGPGLTGLMLACLLAALMSSIDAYMIVDSALVVRNIYSPYINPNASEKEYLLVGRVTGAVLVGGAVVISLFVMDVFKQLQLTWVFGVLFAAPFWVGMYWRRATRTAAWITVTYCLLVFFVIPWAAPMAYPALRTTPYFLTTNQIRKTTVRRVAAQASKTVSGPGGGMSSAMRAIAFMSDIERRPASINDAGVATAKFAVAKASTSAYDRVRSTSPTPSSTTRQLPSLIWITQSPPPSPPMDSRAEKGGVDASATQNRGR